MTYADPQALGCFLLLAYLAVYAALAPARGGHRPMIPVWSQLLF